MFRELGYPDRGLGLHPFLLIEQPVGNHHQQQQLDPTGKRCAQLLRALIRWGSGIKTVSDIDSEKQGLYKVFFS